MTSPEDREPKSPSDPPPDPPPDAPADDEYGVADQEPAAPEPLELLEASKLASPGGTGGAAEAGGWHVGLPDGRHEGPLPLPVIKVRIASGDLRRQTLVWREGMAGWVPAGEVPELFETRPADPGGPDAGAGTSEAGVQIRAASADVMRHCDSLFVRPVFFRVFGRVCAVLAVLMLAIGVIGVIVKSYGFFSHALLLALLFLIGEATAAILERLDGRP